MPKGFGCYHVHNERGSLQDKFKTIHPLVCSWVELTIGPHRYPPPENRYLVSYWQMGVRGSRNLYFLLGVLRVLAFCYITPLLASLLYISHIWFSPQRKEKTSTRAIYPQAKPWPPVDFRKIPNRSQQKRFIFIFSSWWLHFLQKDKEAVNRQYIVIVAFKFPHLW